MNASQLRPASQLACRFGVKAIIYGGPGSAKTPLVNTCPRPVMCVTEPGMLSMRTSNVPCWQADTPERIKEFFDWLKGSSETKHFDTIAVDSLSQMAEVILKRTLEKNAHGLKAYGEMSEAVQDYMGQMFYMPAKHVYLICKEMVDDVSRKKKPWFPGKELPVKVPHMYDEVLHVGHHNVPGFIGPVHSILTRDSFDTMARDRSGKLNEFEEPHIGKLFEKCMS